MTGEERKNSAFNISSRRNGEVDLYKIKIKIVNMKKDTRTTLFGLIGFFAGLFLVNLMIKVSILKDDGSLTSVLVGVVVVIVTTVISAMIAEKNLI